MPGIGPDAVLSHRDAAALHGLRPPGDHARGEVTTTGRASSTATIRVFRTTTLDPDDATTVDGIPATGVARTRRRAVDLRAIERAMAATARPRRVAKALARGRRYPPTP